MQQASLFSNPHRMTVKTVTVDFDPGAEYGPQAADPEAALALVRHLIAEGDSDQERFGFIALDSRHRMIGYKVLTHGTSNQAPVDAKKLYRAALLMGAEGLVLFHNHPSGDTEPSGDDLRLTQRLAKGAALLGMLLHDHIITTPGGRGLSLRKTNPERF